MALATLDAVPLHSKDFSFCAVDNYYACEYPERPPVFFRTMWDFRCYPCYIHAKASVERVQVATVFGDEGHLRRTMAEALVEADEYWRTHDRHC
jgi:hypothetical protein